MAANEPATPHASHFATWADYKQYVRQVSGGRLPAAFRDAEDALICRFADILGVDRDFFDSLLYTPEIFAQVGIHAGTVMGRHMWVTTTDPFHDDHEVVEKLGGVEEYRRRCEVEAQRRWEEHQARKAERDPKPPTRYWLYHIFGESDRLLYIGITRNPEGREKAHRKRWGDVIERFEYAEYTSHDELLVDEARLIAEHNPPFNAQHVGGVA